MWTSIWAWLAEHQDPRGLVLRGISTVLVLAGMFCHYVHWRDWSLPLIGLGSLVWVGYSLYPLWRIPLGDLRVSADADECEQAAQYRRRRPPAGVLTVPKDAVTLELEAVLAKSSESSSAPKSAGSGRDPGR